MLSISKTKQVKTKQNKNQVIYSLSVGRVLLRKGKVPFVSHMTLLSTDGIYSHGDVHVEYHPNGITTPLHWVDATLEVCVCVSGGVYLQRAESPSSMLQKPIDNICN